MTRSTRRLVVGALALSCPASVASMPAAAFGSPIASCATRVAAVAKHTDAGDRYVRVARSSRVEVYAPRGAGFGAYHYLCRRSTGTLHRFARNSGGAADSDVLSSSFVVRGEDVAYRTAVRGDRSTDRFVVRSGRTGRVLRDSGAVPTTDAGAPRTDQLLLLPGATLAWATRDAGVHVTDADGDHVLAPSGAGTPTRLRATATTLSWTAHGRRLHARLP